MSQLSLFPSRFQSTLPRGERQRRAVILGISLEFQSTLPRGERPDCCRDTDIDIQNFNPRSHEGSDAGCHCIIGPQSRFQSTLPRGERRIYEAELTIRWTFQSTLPRGERHLFDQVAVRCSDFNPRSHEGSDRHRGAASQKSHISIHAPTRGATILQ